MRGPAGAAPQSPLCSHTAQRALPCSTCIQPVRKPRGCGPRVRSRTGPRPPAVRERPRPRPGPRPAPRQPRAVFRVAAETRQGLTAAPVLGPAPCPSPPSPSRPRAFTLLSPRLGRCSRARRRGSFTRVIEVSAQILAPRPLTCGMSPHQSTHRCLFPARRLPSARRGSSLHLWRVGVQAVSPGF